MTTYALSCTLYEPPPDDVSASDHLITHLKYVLDYYGIDFDHDLASSTSDAGSDVKCALLKKTGAQWDWCVPHELHCALVEAFGMTKDPLKSKNRASRDKIQALKKCIEYIHKSPQAAKRFKDLQMWVDDEDAWLEGEGEEEGSDRKTGKRPLKLPTEAEQRWSSMVGSYCSFLMCFTLCNLCSHMAYQVF